MVTAVIAIFCPDTGSVDLGYVLVAVLPSISQVKDSALSAIEIVFDVVKVCPAAVITISPVDGVYTMLVTGFGKAPTLLVTCPDTYV